MLKVGTRRLITFSVSALLVILAFTAINAAARTGQSETLLAGDLGISMMYYMPVQLSTPPALQAPSSLHLDSNGVLSWTADPAAHQHQIEVQVNSLHWHTTSWSSFSGSGSHVWFDLRSLNIPFGSNVRVRVRSRETTGQLRTSYDSPWLDISHWHGWGHWYAGATGSNVRTSINAFAGQNISGIDLINVTIHSWHGSHWNYWHWSNASIEFRWRHEGSGRWYTGNRVTASNWNWAAGASWTAAARLPFTDVRGANAGYYRLYVYSNLGGSWQRIAGPVGSRVRLNVDGRYWYDRWYWDRWYWDNWYWGRWNRPAFVSPRAVPPAAAATGGVGGTARVETPAAQRQAAEPEHVLPVEEPVYIPYIPHIPEFPNPFVDVTAADWFYNYVRLAFHNHLMVGTGTAPMTFSPHAPLTRAMAVTILFNMAQPASLADTNNLFSDVDLGSWYATPVIWASSLGIISGFGDGRFGPNENVTMQDLTVILNNYARTRGWVIPPVHYFIARDPGANAAGYAQEAIMRFAMAGVIDGNLGNVFYPTRHATRAETAAMLIRFNSAWTY